MQAGGSAKRRPPCSKKRQLAVSLLSSKACSIFRLYRHTRYFPEADGRWRAMFRTALFLLSLAVSAEGSTDLSHNGLDPRSKSFYDSYHENRAATTCSACKFIGEGLQYYPDAKRVLDAGAGNCLFTRHLLSDGYDAKGIELSSVAVEKHCSDLAEKKVVFQGSLAELPFEDGSFDLVTSFEVLEHVPPELTGQIVRELVRVSTGRLFLTISLRLSNMDKHNFKNPAVHINVHPRPWWDQQFAAAGCRPDTEILSKVQGLATKKETHMCQSKFGKKGKQWMQLCKVQGGETQPWFFVYQCNK